MILASTVTSAQATRWYYTGINGESCDTLCAGLRALDNTTLSLACDLSAFSVDGAFKTYFPANVANMIDIYYNRLATGYIGAVDPARCGAPPMGENNGMSNGMSNFDLGDRSFPAISTYGSCVYSTGPSMMSAAAVGTNTFVDGGLLSACSARPQEHPVWLGLPRYARLCPCKAASAIPTPSPRPRGGACFRGCTCSGSTYQCMPEFASAPLPDNFTFADNWPHFTTPISTISLVCLLAARASFGSQLATSL